MAKRGQERIINDSQPKFDYSNYKLTTVKDYFIEYLFPDAIIYGMSYDEFWNKDPELFFSYRFSFMKKVEIDQEKINYQAWLNGLYNYVAHATALSNAFGGNSRQRVDYLHEPINFNEPKTKVDTEEKFLDVRKFWSRFKERRYK